MESKGGFLGKLKRKTRQFMFVELGKEKIESHKNKLTRAMDQLKVRLLLYNMKVLTNPISSHLIYSPVSL